mgnify:CR=1 FL=1
MSNEDGKAPPNLKTPLLQWMAAYAMTGDMRVSPNNRDIRMGGAASMRIAVGLSEENAHTYVGIAAGDDIPLGSIPITSVAFARKIQDRDWLVIVTNDATDGRSKKPIPLRIWFPANTGIFDAWCGIKPDETVTLCSITPDMIPIASPDSIQPIGEFPLTLQGDWKGVEVIETIEDEPEIEIESLQMPEMGGEETFFTKPTSPATAPATTPAAAPALTPVAPTIDYPIPSDSEDEDLAAAWGEATLPASEMDDIYAAMDQVTRPPSP